MMNGIVVYQAALASAFNDLLLTFVNTVDLCYKLKLILEQFGVPTCVLNSEVPASSRSRAVTQFNTGTYDVIIASDEQVLEESHKINQKSKRKKKKEPGVARALSFIVIRERPLMEKDEEELKKYAWRATTTISIREARLKEIKQKVLTCDKLKSYFEDNPCDLQSMRQDTALHTVKLQAHLKDVPEYIVPASLKRLIV
ncbi:hypothetical protein HCN44_007755 [Aphidius gifuensis]|uniref:Helicase C-terminal domain-containing protein n=1 Tax=Aphidius gifuensis TaxID=684658 RepID=A0A834XL17_APHGI|nr:hypothetical protein HCN44_007755 [Aphidius gifuensis]